MINNTIFRKKPKCPNSLGSGIADTLYNLQQDPVWLGKQGVQFAEVDSADKLQEEET